MIESLLRIALPEPLLCREACILGHGADER